MNDRFKFRVWNNKMQKFHIVFSMHGIVNDTLEGYAKDDNFVLEQCTGLKDKNGKLIYEGDILKSIYSEIMQYRIYWEGRGYRMRVYGSDNKIVDDCPIFTNAADVLEVIGNIHENADLLGEEE